RGEAVACGAVGLTGLTRTMHDIIVSDCVVVIEPPGNVRWVVTTGDGFTTDGGHDRLPDPLAANDLWEAGWTCASVTTVAASGAVPCTGAARRVNRAVMTMVCFAAGAGLRYVAGCRWATERTEEIEPSLRRRTSVRTEATPKSTSIRNPVGVRRTVA